MLIYLAGAYSSDSIEGVRDNIKRGLDLTALVIREFGCGVYSPWLDWELYLHYGFTAEEMKRSSMAVLEKADAVLVQPVGAKKSKGTQAEIMAALGRQTPVFYTMDSLKNWFNLVEESS